jgi:hypothetical protein
VADPFSLRLIGAVISGRAASYLDLDERPPYEDVGRLCRWEPFYSDVFVERSRLEQIVMHALSGGKLRLDAEITRRPACKAGLASCSGAMLTVRSE